MARLKLLSRAAPLALWLAMSTVGAQPVGYALDPQHTRVYWEVRHFGTSTHRGRFDALQGNVTLDRAARKGEVQIAIDTKSVSTGVPALDGMLRGNLFLAAEANPTAFFTASTLSFDGDRLAELRGEFMLRGVTRPLTLKALSFNCYDSPLFQREVCGGDFEGELTRSEFGSTFGLPFVGDKVRLLISVEGARIAP